MSGDDYIRIDWVMEILSADEDNRYVKFEMKPEPRRYEIIEKNGEVFYFDKFQKILISQKAIAESMSQIEGFPIYAGNYRGT